MKHTLTVLIAIVVLLLAACTDTLTLSRLERAQRVMDSRPDSALAILDSINPDSLTSTEHKARYAVLAAQASFKNKIIPTDDSLLRIAVDYYKGRGDSAEMKALFYMGNVRYYRGFYASAIVPAMHARELAIKLGDDYWRAKSAEMLADIYSSTYYDDSDMRKEAVEYYLKAGKIPNHRYAICDLALGEGNRGNFNRAIKLLDSIAKIARRQSDASLLLYNLQEKLPFCLLLGKKEEAKETVCEIKNLAPDIKLTPKQSTYFAEVYFDSNDTVIGQEMLKNALDSASDYSSKIVANKAYLDFCFRQGNYTEAEKIANLMIDDVNVAVNDALEQSVMVAQRDYYESLAVFESEKSRSLKIIIILSIIFFVIVVFFIIIVFRLKIKLNKNKLENSMSKIRELIADAKERTLFINDLQAQIALSHNDMNHVLYKVFNERLYLLNKLCEQFYEKNNSMNQTSIEKQIEREIKELQSDNNLSELLNSINEVYEGFVDRLGEQCPFLKESDINLIALIHVGLSPKAICLMLNMGIKIFYSKRARLYERITTKQVADEDEFLHNFK